MRAVLFTVMMNFCLVSLAQQQEIYLSGYTRDSTTFELLPYVTVHSLSGKPVGATNENGYFSLKVIQGDTLVFTRLGYKPLIFAPERTSWDLNVALAESIKVLDNVTIYDRYIIHGNKEIQQSLKEGSVESSPYKNQTQMPGNATMIQTFGPGMVVNGAISRLAGVDKEKRKVSQGKAEYIKTHVYLEVVQSLQVKEYFMGQFGLSEREYFTRMERFKVNYPNAVYLRTRQEIIDVMAVSFATKAK